MHPIPGERILIIDHDETHKSPEIPRFSAGRAPRSALVLNVSIDEQPPKLAVAESLLLENSIFVHLDPRDAAVRVPSWLKSGAQLVLQLGYTMAIPIHDLALDEDGIVATLSFNRSPFSCWIPWSAVFAVVAEDGKGMMWPEFLPDEIANDMDREFAQESAADLEELLSGRGHDADPMHSPSEVRSSITSRPLRLIGTPNTPNPSVPRSPRVPTAPSVDPTPPPNAHLRLVKS